MEIFHFSKWFEQLENTKFLLIAGPCSAETEEQVLKTAEQLAQIPEVKVFRAGVWKPRTKPDTFQGVGMPALDWLKLVKQKFNLLTTTEVANAQHVDQVLKSEAIDIIWIGARTVSNPFSVQEIADALKGVDIPVMVKNPIHPDIELWIGAIERFYKAGIKKLAAIHRGFYPFEKHKLRNIPKWEIPIELKTRLPNLPIIGDPSHIAGDVCYIEEVAQKALDLNFDGLMLEVHINPKKALSDAKQQLTPKQFADLIKRLKIKDKDFGPEFISQLQKYRFQIDSIDYQILELLAKRMEIVRKIGEYKNKHNISIFQLQRWREILKTRTTFGTKLGLSQQFIHDLLQIIHKEAINQQINITKNGSKQTKKKTT